jgi:hypothetical protein
MPVAASTRASHSSLSARCCRTQSTATFSKIAAGKNQRWDVVKWTVTVNVALAAASIAVKQQVVSAGFCIFAFVIAVAACLLVFEITRRMTATRNDGLAPHKYLIKESRLWYGWSYQAAH